MSFWSSLFGKPKPEQSPQRDAQRYEAEKNIAQSPNVSGRMQLATDPKTHQEILYFMAQHDPDPQVRRAVAENRTTPVHATSILASDQDQDVRLALAGRLVGLLPDLSQDKQSQLYAYCIQALGTLALDEVLKIRVALSSALKDHAHAPPKVVGQLARDIEREVSEPVLRFCLALSDEDLLDILKNHPDSWAVQAIAGRAQVSEPISQAVIDTDDADAGEILLQNKGALISTRTLGDIVEKAKTIPQWQKPIAVRKHLPPELAKELCSFVDQSVRTLLLERTDLDGETMEEISQIVQRRLEFSDIIGDKSLSAEDRVKKLAQLNRLNEAAIDDAMGMRDRDFAVVALAALLRTTKVNIETIVALQAPKPILAICWKVGLSMRLALRLQKELALIPAKELIYPRGGTDYPLDQKEMEWQLEFLGLKK